MLKKFRFGVIVTVVFLGFMLRPPPVRMAAIPVAADDTFATEEDTPLYAAAPGILINDSDEDGDSLTAVLVGDVAHGTLTLNANGSFTYTPAADYNGADSFTYQANDGGASSDPVTVSITVSAVNDAPTAGDLPVSTDEDTAVGVTLSGADPDGGSLTFSVVTPPANGVLSGTAPDLTYTPNSQFSGSDSFTYKATDGALDSNVATVTINVNPVNDAPAADGQGVTTGEDAAVGITLTGSDPEGSPLTFNIGTAPANGVLSGTAPDLTYTPNSEFSGADTFTFTVGDGSLDSAEATVNITVNEVNDAPAATPDGHDVNEDETLGVPAPGVLGNDGDTEGNPLTAVLVGDVSHGTLTLNADGSFTYTPAANYSGPDSFTYKANDGAADSGEVTVSITVNGVNDAPSAAADAYGTDEDAPLTVNTAGGVLANDSDSEGGSLTATLVSDVTHGTLTFNADGSFDYTPNTDFGGADSFSYKVSDGAAESAAATVTINVSAVNDAPAAAGQTVNTGEDTPVAVTLTGSDPEGGTLTFNVVSGPSHGALSGTAPNLTYTPAADFNGADSFTFTVSDGGVTSAEATVTVDVGAANDAPTAGDQSISTGEDTPLAVTLTGTDPDGGALTFSVLSGPSNGALSGTAPNLTYTPNAEFVGTDSLTFKVSDGAVDSNVGTVTITVNAVNDAPAAAPQSVTTNEDAPLAISLSGSDPEGESLTFTVVTPPSHGSFAAGVYTPAADFNGSDSFTFKANDGATDSSEATVSITVNSVNDAPVAADGSATTDEDTAKAVTLAASDVEGDSLTFAIVTGPAHGTLSGTAPSLTYTPNANYNGSDSFTFTAGDGSLVSAEATVTITVNAVNDAPGAAADAYATEEDTPLPVSAPGVLANDADADGDSLLTVLVGDVSHGTLTLNADGSFTYTPAANYSGPDSFTYKANDGAVDSPAATVSITVTGVNDAPAAAPDSYSTNEDTPLAVVASGVLANDSDAEGGPLTAVLVSNVSHGALTLNADGSFTYTPSAGYSGPDGFSYKSSDGSLESTAATVSLTVNVVNAAPVAGGQSVATTEDVAKAVTLAATDGDGDGLTFTVVTPPAHGTLSGTAPNLTYTPAANYSGPDSFTFKANDGTADSNTATVAITVTPVNDAPVANADSYSVDEGGTLTIATPGLLANDAEPDGSPMTAIKLTNPVNGTVTSFNSNGAFTYKPKADYSGPDSFTYKVSDGGLESGAITVTITVNPVNDIPVANSKSTSLKEDGTKAIALTGTDIDGDVLTFNVVTPPAHGTLSGTSPNLTYAPELNYNGPDSFTYVANDGLADSLEATVTITVNPANDAPVAAAQLVTAREDTPKAITLEATDIDGNVLTYTVVMPPAHGTLTGTAPDLTYTPAADYSGSDSFTFRVNDGVTNSNTATVSITVNQGNDAPAAADQSVATFINVAKAITLTGTDSDGDALMFGVITPPAHGTLTGTEPNLIYTPATGYTGADSFTFKANDGELDSNVATVSITVNSLDSLPVANPDGYIVNEDGTLNVAAVAAGVLANDTSAPGTTRTAIKLTNPANATAAFTFNSNGTFNYKPKSNFNGTDSFTYKVSDGTFESAPATVTITVNPVNDLPVAAAQSVIVAKDASSPITPTATDVDGDALTYTVVTPPSHGVLTGTAPDLTYTPTTGYTGADSFTFRASDPAGGLSAIATISITVNPLDPNITAVNDKYVAKNPNQIIAASKGVLLNDTDALGRAKTAVLVDKPAHGTIALKTDGGFTYTPAPGYYGSDSFTYRARAGNSLSNLATVDLAVEYEALTKVDLPIVATVASLTNLEYIQLDGIVKFNASAIWNYQVKQLNDSACELPTPGFYQSDYNKTSFVGTAVGLSSGHAYEFKISSSKHDLCTPFPPFDWHRIINVILKDKVTGISYSTAFVHQVHVNADGFTDVPPILDGNFIVKQAQSTQQWAYVTNPGANTVTVVDLKGRKLLKTIPVGASPDGVAVMPTASHVYVANSGSDTVSVIDPVTNTVVATIPVGDEPRRVVIDPLGLRAYVTNRASNSVSVIDTATRTVVDTIDAADGFAGLAPVGLAINHVGTQLFVSNVGSNTVSVINTATGATAIDMVTPGVPGELAVNQDGSRLAVSLPNAASVLLINTADHTTAAQVPVGVNPGGLDFAAPGDRLYVANTGSNSVSVIDIASNSVTATITDGLGTAPTGVDVSDHGLQFSVTHAGSNNLSDVVIQNTSNVVSVTHRVKINIAAGPGASKVAMLF